MNQFIIYANEYLRQNIQGYYHENYTRYGNPGNPDYLNDLKNTFGDFSKEKLNSAINQLLTVLKTDLSKFDKDLTVCVIPRSKAENTYIHNQLLFKKVVQHLINELGFQDGSDHIITQLSHLNPSNS